MGVAATLVRSWENGTAQADSQQLKVLADILGFNADIWRIGPPA